MAAPVPHIAIIGSGVVGLTTALELTRRSCTVTVYADRARHHPASFVAPALFTPYIGPDQALSIRWASRALERLLGIAHTAGPDSGVTIGELREYWYSPHHEPPEYNAMLQRVPLRPVPAPCTDASTTTRPHIDMLRYLPWLESQARARNVNFITRSIASFDELFSLGHATIVNCSGMGATQLASDPLVRPMHGQIIHVPNDINLTHSIHDDAPKGLVTYIFRFADRLVLGGTFDAGRGDSTTDPSAIDAIIDRGRNMLRMDGHPRWRELATTRIRALAAARPTRGAGTMHEDIRVEGETLKGGRTIIHNYGHGRSGVTLSWATAEQAALLVDNACAISPA